MGTAPAWDIMGSAPQLKSLVEPIMAKLGSLELFINLPLVGCVASLSRPEVSYRCHAKLTVKTSQYSPRRRQTWCSSRALSQPLSSTKDTMRGVIIHRQARGYTDSHLPAAPGLSVCRTW